MHPKLGRKEREGNDADATFKKRNSKESNLFASFDPRDNRQKEKREVKWGDEMRKKRK